MNKIVNFMAMLPFIMLGFLVSAQTTGNKKADGYFTNPIFRDDYPAPSILREGNDHYVVHSSFESYPDFFWFV